MGMLRSLGFVKVLLDSRIVLKMSSDTSRREDMEGKDGTLIVKTSQMHGNEVLDKFTT